MVIRLQSWWQKNKQHRVTFLIFAITLAVASALIIAECIFNGTGFKGKTLWDWLQLLIIPFVLAAGGYLFNLAVSRTEQQRTTDNQREAALQTYIDKMSELLVEKKLTDSPKDSKVRKIARVRTLTVLPRLDSSRKATVLQFLYEAGLIIGDQSVVDIGEADFNKADLRGFDLEEANLQFVYLNDAQLSYANLKKANLHSAYLIGAKMQYAELWYTNLDTAHLDKADLKEARLVGANLHFASLKEAKLVKAYMYDAKLIEQSTFLATSGLADLSAALLRGAILSGADLTGAKFTEAQLKEIKSLQGATMPDGSKHP